MKHLKFHMAAVAFLILPMAHAGMSLQESMNIAFERNPKTQANDLRLKAMAARTEAAWRAFLPTFSVSYNLSKSQSDTTMGDTIESGRSQNRSLSYTLSMNIFDGGATYYGAKAAEASEKARAAQYNSTNALIPNTKGAIAGLVFNAYTNILRNRQQIAFAQYLKTSLEKILTAATTSDEQNQVKSLLASMDVEISNTTFEDQNAAREFEYVVKIPAPLQIDTYEESIARMQIPENQDKAIDVALQKSPELKVASYQLESMQLGYKAERAATYSPRVDAYVSKSHSTSSSSSDPAIQVGGTSAGLSVRWSFSPRDLSTNKAAALEVEAAQKDKDGALDELKYSLESTYPKLANDTYISQQFDKNLATSRKNLDDLLRRIDQGEKIKIDYAVSLISNLQMNWSQSIMMKQSVLATKFMIQKTIGTLFEQVTSLRDGSARN